MDNLSIPILFHKQEDVDRDILVVTFIFKEFSSIKQVFDYSVH